ncbi:hypothetical protein Acsp01_03050 [Actinoplanes sp. NBRC 101535]|nr:hypothetical protein Acsp01_03050 [Actinoplanes sp. NBRC 101535]
MLPGYTLYPAALAGPDWRYGAGDDRAAPGGLPRAGRPGRGPVGAAAIGWRPRWPGKTGRREPPADVRERFVSAGHVTYEVVCRTGTPEIARSFLAIARSFLAIAASPAGRQVAAGAGYAPLPEDLRAEVAATIAGLR